MTANTPGLDTRLERGEIVTFAPCPFDLPAGDDRQFLLQQQIKSSAHKNISYNPANQSVSGFREDNPEQARRLGDLMRAFSQNVQGWLAQLLPSYARSWHVDRASLRPEEEATRKLRHTARNDLLHFDAFPSRPARGHRILRCYVNVNPTDERVWMSSETFERVLEKYGEQVGLPAPHFDTWVRRVGQGVLRLFQPGVAERTEYDEFMLRLHHFLKSNDEFQDRAARKLWHFAPGTAWLLFSDGIAHAELRGQFALEHSFFVAPDALTLPDHAPAALLQRMCGTRVQSSAA